MKKQILLLLLLALAKTYSAESALFDAIDKNNVDLVAQLLADGASANVFNDTGDSPLHLAISIFSDAAIPTLLLKYGANIEEEDTFGNTPLISALELDNIAIAKLLVDYGANVNGRGEGGQTPLITSLICSDNEDVGPINLLITKGANLEATDCHGETVLHKAARYNEVIITRHLLDHGANINAENKEGDTPLYLGLQTDSEFGDYTEIVKLLLERGSKQKDINDNTPLHIAALFGKIEVVRFLIPASKKPCQNDSLMEEQL